MRILHSKKLVFISKPRCGSTSARNVLTKLMKDGDEYCDYAGQFPNMHPHMSAAAVQNQLKIRGVDFSDYTFFTVTRHPADMLWSVYKFFRPDINSKYTWSKRYDENNLIEFNDWVIRGKISPVLSSDYSPAYISDRNLSPLSLEAFVCNHAGKMVVDKYFKLEAQEELTNWLSAIFDTPISLPHVNASAASARPELSERALERIRELFPLERDLYAI